MARLQKKKISSDKTRKKDASSVETSEDAAKGVSASSRVVPPRGAGKVNVAASPSDPNVFQKGMTFLREVRVELKKVTWPTRKQTAGSTVVVIILVFILAAFLGLVDISLSKLVQIVLA